jgi:hypothetical protein
VQLFAELYFPLGVVSGLTLPPLDVLPPMLAFAPVDDFMLAPVVVDELVEVDVGCLCLCIFADAAKGEPARPAITSAAIVSLLFIMTWNSSLDHTGGNCRWRARFQRHYECLITDARCVQSRCGAAPASKGATDPGPPIPHGVLPTRQGESAPEALGLRMSTRMVPTNIAGRQCQSVALRSFNEPLSSVRFVTTSLA